MPPLSTDQAGRSAAFDHFPIRLSQTASTGSKVSRVLLLIPAVAAITFPFVGLAVASTTNPTMLDALAERPLATLQIATGLALWVGLFLLPARRILQRLWASREVVIADGSVDIIERTWLGSRRTSTPVASYMGLAHHIRASLSGLTHEIILVHAEPSLTVTLMAGDRVTQTMLDDAKALLNLPEIPARAIYERDRSVHSARPSPTLEPVQA